MQKAQVQPYVFFSGNCAEAIEFYKSALGATVDMVMTYDQSPEKAPEGRIPPNWGDKIMHASFHVGESQIMASDGCGEAPGFRGFMLSISVPTEADADRYFNALSPGGTVIMPLTKTFWSKRFGMLKDKFGMEWMINVVQPCE